MSRPVKFNWKAFVQTIIAWLYYGSGLFALHLRWRCRSGWSLLILTFHRVLAADSPVLQQHLSLRSIIVTQKNFQSLLKFLQKYFRFISLSEFVQGLRQSRHVQGRYCIVTFDDGYRDFLQYAWPVLQAQHLPVTMFLPTALIGASRTFWWDRVYHTCMTIEQVELHATLDGAAPLLQRIVNVPVTQRAPLIYQLIDLLQSWPETKVQALLDNLASRESKNGHLSETANALLNWEEVKTLRKSGVAFGSHTRHHLNLAAISPESLQEEVALSRRDLESMLQEPIDSLSFPGGHFSEAVLEVVAAAGYALAFSTQEGMNRPGEKMLCLRRVNIWDGKLQDFRGRFSPAVFALNLMRADLASH